MRILLTTDPLVLDEQAFCPPDSGAEARVQAANGRWLKSVLTEREGIVQRHPELDHARDRQETRS